MPTPRISVIVPIYKVEDCLAWCLDSLVAQDMTDFEAILVNDGSPDGSREIAERYALCDDRFKLVDKENGGLSSARNAGIRVASAPVVAFLDSDDRFTPDACRVICETFDQTGADIVTFGANAYPPEASYPWLEHVLSPRDAQYEGYSPDILFKEASRPFAWRTACSRSFLQESAICFEESVKYGEDQVFDFAIYPRAKKTVFISNKLYDYRVARSGSLMDTMRQSDEARLLEHVKIYAAIVRDWRRDGLFEKYPNDLAFFLCEFALYDALRLLKGNAISVFAAAGKMLKEEGCVFLASSDGLEPSVRSMLECALEETAPKAAATRAKLMADFDALRYGRRGALRRVVANMLGR